MGDRFDQICGANKQFDPRYDTLSRMRRYIDTRMKAKGPFDGFNYKPQESETETATALIGFLNHMESQFRQICQEKTDYVLDDEKHGVDCRYQLVMEFRDDIMGRLQENIQPIRPQYACVSSRTESEQTAKAA